MSTKPMAFSYDGRGINDAADPYRRRILTFTVVRNGEERKLQDEIGNLLAAAPALLAACEAFARLTSEEYNEECKRGEHQYPDVDLAVARKHLLAAIRAAKGDSNG